MSEESLQLELKTKRICRFCMTQAEPLSNMYSRENRLKSSAPLPLQIMSCVSIEVFTNDGMPSTICDDCRMLMEHCYRFKQMCKKSDTALRQYPLTGTWPKPLEIPKLSEELVLKMHPHLNQKQRIIATTQTDNKKDQKGSMKIYNLQALSATTAVQSNPSTIIITSNVPQPAVVTSSQQHQSQSVIFSQPQQQQSPQKPRLLNKNSIKILNKEAQKNSEPVLSQPIIKRDSAGNVEIITEILEQGSRDELQVDPIKNAAPVETNVFPCPNCERSFPLRQLLDIHMVNHSRERGFQCKICSKRFFSKYDLGKHMLIHTGEKPFECIVCKKAFTRSTLLHRHEKIHTDQPKFLCVYCEKPFLSKEEMDKHSERHKKNRPFVCKICNKAFAFKQGLERHEAIHVKDQPYPCQYCDHSFSTPSKLARHLTAHAGERPFPCKLCPKSYLLSHHLTRHLRSHKQSSGSYKCFDCEKVFSTRDGLIYHSAVHATQTLVCPLCKENFDDLDLVTKHIKNHAEGEQYACEFCDLIFMTADKLQLHCDNEHSEDLAAYEEHDNKSVAARNIKTETTIQNYTDDSQESLINNNEVIEEFIIEEYTQEDDETHRQIVDQSLIKKENEIILGKNLIIMENNGDNTNVNQQHEQQEQEQKVNQVETVICDSFSDSMKSSIFMQEFEEEYSEDIDMEFEALTNDQREENEEYLIDSNVEEIKIDDGPSASKYMKLNPKEQQTDVESETAKRKEASIKSSTQSVSQIDRKILGERKSTIKIEKDTSNAIAKSKQSSVISTVLKQLPKSVTVTKKETQTTEKSDETSPSSKETLTGKKITQVLNSTKPSSQDKISTRKSDNIKIETEKNTENPTSNSTISSKSSNNSNKNISENKEKQISSSGNNNSVKRESSSSLSSSSSSSSSPNETKLKFNSNATSSSPSNKNKKLVEMMFGDRKVKVQKIVMSKSQIEMMAKEGKIEMKDGAIILKQGHKSASSSSSSPGNKQSNKSKMMTRSKQQKQTK